MNCYTPGVFNEIGYIYLGDLGSSDNCVFSVIKLIRSILVAIPKIICLLATVDLPLSEKYNLKLCNMKKSVLGCTNNDSLVQSM